MTDLIDSQRKMIEVADHKARFALVIMGAVNAVLLLFATRASVVASIPETLRPWVLLVVVPYGAVTFAFLLHAADVLRPHMREWPEVRAEFRSGRSPAELPAPDEPAGIVYWGAVLERDLAGYTALWTEASVAQVTSELALLARGLAHVNHYQTRELRHMFRWLKGMLTLAAVLMAGLTILALR